jgi:membrane protein YdbS with pleckstrin-like domain
MKLFIKIILLTIIDIILIWFWVKENDPDPSVSIALVLVVPAVIIINLVIAILLYFTKREYSKIFVINSLLSAVIMYILFLNGIDRHQKLRYESWKFNIEDTIFQITHSKLDNTFSISESTNPGSSTGFLDGKFSRKGNEYYLTTDSTEYKIRKEYFYGFRNSKDSIKLTKIER